MITYTDKQLIEMAEKNENSFQSIYTTFYERYKKITYNYCFSLTNDENEAHEVFQEGWCKFWENLTNKRKIFEPIINYLFKILHDKNIDRIRKKGILDIRYFDDINQKELASDINVERDMISKDMINQIHIILNKISIKLRDVFVMYWFKEMSFEEIAESLNVDVTVIRTRLYRANIRICEEFEKIK